MMGIQNARLHRAARGENLMRNYPLLVSIVLSGAIVALPAAAQPSARDIGKPGRLVIQGTQLAPEPYVIRIDDTPDVSQHIKWKEYVGFPGGYGRHSEMDKPAANRNSPPDEYNRDMRVFPSNFCGPASIANNLIWLDRTGYPNISDETNKFAAATELARKLGFSYMDTMSQPDNEQYKLSEVIGEDLTWSDIPEGTGTSVPGLVNGTVKFLSEKNVPIKNIRITAAFDYKGPWEYETNGAPFSFNVKKPTGEDISAALRRRSVVVTIHGHYVPLFDPLNPQAKDSSGDGELGFKDLAPKYWDTPYLMRTGGHVATPVGYGVDENMNPAPGKIVYHDSSNGLQSARYQHFYDWTKVSSGHNGRNPVLVSYEKRKTLKNEDLRCHFAPEKISTGPDGEAASVVCRGNLAGHSVFHYPSSSNTPLKRVSSIGGLPNITDNTSLKVLEFLVEIEVEDPPVEKPARLGRN